MTLVPLQQVNPIGYKMWMESTQQPGANLNETNAAAGAQGASAAHSMALIPGAQAESAIQQQQAKQLQILQNAGDAIKQSKGNNRYVSPEVYNAQKFAYTNAGGDERAFDNTYIDNTNPNSMDYNTANGRDIQAKYTTTKNQFQSFINQYRNIPQDQKGMFSAKAEVSQIPLLGQLFAPQAASYEDNRKGLAATLAPTLGGGEGSNLKINLPELQQWVNFLPSAKNTPSYNNSNIEKLNSLLEAKFNGRGLDPQYLPTQSGHTIISVH